MSGKCEFVIEQQRSDIVYECKTKIEKQFNVKVSFLNGGSQDKMLWVGLDGPDEERNKAKDYIKALTSPEQESTVLIPASLVTILGRKTREHFRLEAEYGVFIRFPQETKAIIAGNVISVTLAKSKLEGLIEEHEAQLRKPAEARAGLEPRSNRALEDFAIKLGYEQADINAVFGKLGATIDQNTLLNELISFEKQRARIVEDRRSPNPIHNTGPVRVYPTREPLPRPLNEMVVSKGVPSTSVNHMTGINVQGFRPEPAGYLLDSHSYMPESHGVIARGCVARTTGQTSKASGSPSPAYAMSSRDYGGVHASGGLYVTSGDGNQIGTDSRHEEQLFQEFLTTGVRYQQFPQSDLRHVVIDGSNVAMSHGNNKVFSCKGIALCIDWFRARGHMEITVFVPQWRKESPKPESPISDQHLLNVLESQGYLRFTPSRRINGRRIVCYDDRFVVRLAENTDGIIVSNDNFKDLAQENPKWREVIEKRLLMYSFVNDMFMPPDDPLGRHGPTLDEFLQKGSSNNHRRLCPYGRRCTYGTRCKFHHPEREDNRLQIYQTLKDMFPSETALILSVMKKFPQEKDAERLASRILDMSQGN